MFHSALPGTSSPLQSSHLGARPEGSLCRRYNRVLGGSGIVVAPSHHKSLRRCAPVGLNSSHPDHSPPPSRTTTPLLGPRYAATGRPVEGGEPVAVIAPLLHHRCCCCCSPINRYVRVGSPRWGVDLGSQLEPVERTPETEQQGGRRKAPPCRK